MNKNKMSWEEIHKLGSFDNENISEDKKSYLLIVSFLLEIDESAMYIFLSGLFKGNEEKIFKVLKQISSKPTKLAEILEQNLDIKSSENVLKLLRSVHTLKNFNKG